MSSLGEATQHLGMRRLWGESESHPLLSLTADYLCTCGPVSRAPPLSPPPTLLLLIAKSAVQRFCTITYQINFAPLPVRASSRCTLIGVPFQKCILQAYRSSCLDLVMLDSSIPPLHAL